MKTIGIIGGMSWESSAEYYRLINQQMKAWLGPTHSAELIMYSLDFHGVAQLELEERWDEFAMVLVDAAKRLERVGAEFICWHRIPRTRLPTPCKQRSRFHCCTSPTPPQRLLRPRESIQLAWAPSS
jgi:hypothetical protein